MSLMLRHVVHERVLIVDVVGGGGPLVEPVLLVAEDAPIAKVRADRHPVVGIDDDVVRHLVLLAVRTLRVDPAGVRDERQAEVFLEAAEAFGEDVGMRFVAIDAFRRATADR